VLSICLPDPAIYTLHVNTVKKLNSLKALTKGQKSGHLLTATGNCLDVDNYVIMVLTPCPVPTLIHPYSRTVGGVGRVSGTFSDTDRFFLQDVSASTLHISSRHLNNALYSF